MQGKRSCSHSIGAACWASAAAFWPCVAVFLPEPQITPLLRSRDGKYFCSACSNTMMKEGTAPSQGAAAAAVGGGAGAGAGAGQADAPAATHRVSAVGQRSSVPTTPGKTKTAEPRRPVRRTRLSEAEGKRVSAALGEGMLRGERMLEDHCPFCPIPLLQRRNGEVSGSGAAAAVAGV